MERVLVVSGSERGREFLRELLRGQEYGQGFFADNSGEARRRMAEDDFSLVIINAPLRDESGEQLALWAAQSTDAGVLLLVKAEIADEVSARVEDSGAMVLPKPISRQFFCQSLKLVSAARRMCSVNVRSGWLGWIFPEGWLCTTAICVALCSSASRRMVRTSVYVPSIPPVLIRTLSISLVA